MRACFMEKERGREIEIEREKQGGKERETGRERNREREKQGERGTGRERNREGERKREKQGGRERGREGRDVEYVQNCLFLKGLTGALAPFSFLVI